MIMVLSSVMGCALHEKRPPPPNIAVIAPAPRERPAERPSIPLEEQPQQADSAVDLELRFIQGFLGMPREAQRRVYAQTEAVYLQDQTPRNLVRYGLLTAIAGADRPAAISRARTDLRSYLGAGPAPGDELAALAALLLRILDDREQLTAQYIAQNDLLQKKLDELKAIEQQLLERSESTKSNPP